MEKIEEYQIGKVLRSRDMKNETDAGNDETVRKHIIKTEIKQRMRKIFGMDSPGDCYFY